MKTPALLAALALALTTGVAAQAADTTKPPLKERAKTTVKKATQKVVPKRVIKKVEEKQPIAVDDGPYADLTEADLKVAEQVFTGAVDCELGANVKIEPDPKKTGYFRLIHAGVNYRMHPVESRTGAVRLEDAQRGALWLQLGNKSMLMSQKQGQRLADECKVASQAAFAEEMKKNPPPSLLGDVDTTTSKSPKGK
ncbi:hypothetical protein [Xenophilus azovorans]|jgi:hypothetical protein|uniref:hypothetical protein n=1 Tax=Xenophilus TaxID=151754 RepID=UPI00068BAB0D|nr:hypothetical protein [Xenophilus azovorans]